MNAVVTCRKCGNDFKAAARRCPHCHTLYDQLASSARIRQRPATRVLHLVMRIAPAGSSLADARPIPLDEGVRTMVGREADGVIGDVMDEEETAFEDVSRVHVHLTAKGREVIVEDVSLRGTYVNDTRLAPYEKQAFSVPVTLRLASGCYVRVELERVP
jgi:hypothetical protein